MIKTQNWHLDTCKCILEQQFEEGFYETTLVNKILQKCNVHSGISDIDLPSIAVENNKRKNQVFKFLLNNFRTKLFEQIQQEENLVWQLKLGISYDWNFTGIDKERILNVAIKGVNLTNAEKSSIRDWADTEFGVGKVII